jgi:hypothetical protein
MARPNPLNPKAVTRKRMEEAGEEDAAPAPAPRKTTMSQSQFSKAGPKDAAKDKAGLAAAIKKRGY